MSDHEIDNYLKALKSKSGRIKKIELALPERKKVWTSQKGKCPICKKDLNPSFCKYIKDSKTNSIKIVCSNCAIKTAKRN